MPNWKSSDLAAHLAKNRPKPRPEGESAANGQGEGKNGILEKELQAQIAAILRRNNIWFAWSRTDKRTRTVIGCPDFLFAVEGIAFAFEVKVGYNKLSDEQKKTETAMILNGWRHHVIRSYNEALEVIKGLKVNVL